MKIDKNLRTIAAALTVLMSGQTLVGAGGWAWPDYSYRRNVSVPADSKPSRLGGDDVAVLTMNTGGLCRADGSDIRMATHDGKARPMRLLMVGPGDQATLAFAVLPGMLNYHVYLGCAKPPPPLQRLDIKRGVLMETWAYEGGGIKTVDEVQKALEKSATFIGRGFRRNIFIGHNPFGPENSLVNVFTAYLLCPVDGEYTFGTSSRDASFILLDDKLVVDFGGFHDVRAEVRAHGKVKLKPGLHKLTYYQVCGGGDPICVAAWKPPGADKIWTIGEESFTPVIQAEPGPLEQNGRPTCIDFTATQLGESFVDNRYYQRFTFQARTFGPVRSPQWTWEFGDGQVGKGESADHVYLVPGEYAVTLKTAGGSFGPMKRTNKLFVSRPWDRIVVNELDSAQTHANIVSEYDYSRLRPDALAEAAVLMDRCERLDAVIAIGDALLRKDKVPAEVLDTVMPIYAKTLVRKGQRTKAVRVLTEAAKMTDNVATQATMLSASGLQLARMGGKDDMDKAIAVFEEVIRKYDAVATVPALRQARIGIGDVWRLRGDYAKARDAYAQAKPKLGNEWTADSFSRGDYERHVEGYLRSKDFVSAQEFLDNWEDAYPMDKLDGYWSLLKARLCMAQDKPADAADEIAVLVKVNPASNYAPQLLMIQNEAYVKLSDPAKAKAALETIAEKYKESPLAAVAAEKLK